MSIKDDEIAAGLRVRCCVPFCNRTMKLKFNDLVLTRAGRIKIDFICGPHWRSTDKKWRRAHNRYKRKHPEFDGRSPFWPRIKRQAIVNGGLV